jgi:hypothetical protein
LWKNIRSLEHTHTAASCHYKTPSCVTFVTLNITYIGEDEREAESTEHRDSTAEHWSAERRAHHNASWSNPTNGGLGALGRARPPGADVEW